VKKIYDGFESFQAPIPVEPWNDTFDATADGPMCVQRKKGSNQMSEDCLRLNVYTQELPQPDKLLSKPVLVYIHGGAYYIGSGLSNHYGGPYYLMDQDIVLVTINYRLGLLGFLSLGTSECPGNAGFKDQVLALKWVQSHIAKFGGDANKVTIMGHSAGGFSVALHMVSPMSKGLFHQVAPMSGAMLPQYNYTTDQVDLARKQCQLLGCASDSPVDEMLKCLRQVNIDEFAAPVHSMFEFGRDNPAILWNVVVEPDFGQERFLTDDPNKLLAKGAFAKVPVLVGITKDELASAAVAVIKSPNLLERFDQDFETVAPICFFYERGTNKSEELSAKLREAYKLQPPVTVDMLPRINEVSLLLFEKTFLTILISFFQTGSSDSGLIGL
jgi:acetylcholinesterase